MNETSRSAFALELAHVSMRFGSNWVLKDVDFSVERGMISGLVGHNGAGKSTLMKLALGVYPPTEGYVRIDGTSLTAARPSAARELGLGMVMQERSLIRTLTGLDNLYLGAERVSRLGLLRRRAEVASVHELCERLGISNSLLRRKVADMSAIEQEMIEIAKAMRQGHTVLILDEPTAPLGRHEIDTLFRMLRSVAAHGTGIVLITHHLTEVFAVCDEVSCLREGSIALSAPTGAVSMDGLIGAMLGSQSAAVKATGNGGGLKGDGGPPRAANAGLELRRICTANKLSDVSFALSPGEILGIAGLAGSGRSTLLRVVFGELRPQAGEMLLNGQPYRPRAPVTAIADGAYLIPEDRRRDGLILSKPIIENVALSILKQFARRVFLRISRARSLTREMMERLDIRAQNYAQVVDELSGGNQQKVVLAKALASQPQLLLLDEPTFGVDVGAAKELLRYLRAEARSGKMLLLVSSDLQELIDLSDRIIVLVGGKITTEVDRRSADFNEAGLLRAMQPKSSEAGSQI
ncbi:MAG TPA: sugar ABC transporter ATP-binding protein [Streptosporangiaceae bacterium]|nr:sugar ABC transporter ATP-binding protein [Streptosporangiaceae bacterium]